ncbi:hypothetical protein R6Q57_003465, partial [Mikania cordata]
ATEKTFKGKNIKLIKKFEKNNCMPLPIEVEDEGGQYKFVGENYSDFIRLISNEVGKVASFHYTSWQNVPDKFKKAIFPTLFEYFDLDRLRNTDQWEGIRLGIHAECQRAYKDRKQEFKNHFDSVGGYEDVEKARTKPLEELNQQAWEQLINQLFLNPDFRKRSEKNKLNRFKQRYTSFDGSKSYAQRRHMEGTSGIEVFKETHYKAGEVWDIMQEEFKRCIQKSGDSESVNQIECLERALRQRRGHIRGVCRVVRHPTPYVSSTYLPQQGEWQNQMDERVEQLKQQLQQQQEHGREGSCHGGNEPSNGRNTSHFGATTSS